MLPWLVKICNFTAFISSLLLGFFLLLCFLSTLILLVLQSCTFFSTSAIIYVVDVCVCKHLATSDYRLRSCIQVKSRWWADSPQFSGPVAALCHSLFDLSISFSIFRTSPSWQTQSVSGIRHKFGQGYKVGMPVAPWPTHFQRPWCWVRH